MKPPDAGLVLRQVTQTLPKKPPAIHRLPASSVIWHVGNKSWGVGSFNPNTSGAGRGARFSPFNDSSGKPVATFYGGDCADVAIMETVFHDVPTGHGIRSVRRVKALGGRTLESFETQVDLQFAKLFDAELGQWSLTPPDISHLATYYYKDTQSFARSVHAKYPTLHGLAWRSRLLPANLVYVMFEDRTPSNWALPHETVGQLDDPSDASARLAEDLASRAGIMII
ncbi:MAG: hypothetical protein DHS20C11_18480 [Lysobacteraceae bacterium]|nr:MAG: hypothetical protein DHS20C11_18480 [Xanthomonadaceae bacterium]